MITKTMTRRILDTLMAKKEEKEIEKVFALKFNNIDNSNQSKRYGVIYDKIVKIKIEGMKKDLCDDIEDEVLQMFLYDRVANIKVKVNTSKN